MRAIFVVERKANANGSIASWSWPTSRRSVRRGTLVSIWGWHGRYKKKRREVIAETFDRLERVGSGATKGLKGAWRSASSSWDCDLATQRAPACQHIPWLARVDVCFAPETGLQRVVFWCRRSATSGLMRRSKTISDSRDRRTPFASGWDCGRL